MNGEHLLIVDDEHDLLSGLQRMIIRRFPDSTIIVCDNGEDALARARETSFAVALIDLQMPGMKGQELLARLQEVDPRLTVIMMTAYGSIELAVDAIKQGAYDFLTKPLDRELLFRVLAKGIERNRLLRENFDLRQKVGTRDPLKALIGQSPPMRRLLTAIQTVARTDYTVLVRGESGTGKELVAKAIHARSTRSDRPLVMVNCPAIPEHLLESELFGHSRGAFTGAEREVRGLFVEADGGTICLDEIGDIPLSVQTKLLRVLQEQEVRALGSSKTRKIDVRVLALTNRNLEEMIAQGGFREDLFYRLNVLSVHAPPLRDMPEDIPLLAEHFAAQTCSELDLTRRRFTADALDFLASRSWQGNVRELQNAVRRAIIFCPHEIVAAGHFTGAGGERFPSMSKAAVVPETSDFLLPYKEAKEKVLAEFTEKYVSRLLAANDGNVTRAAEISGLTRTALQKILRRSTIRASSFRSQEE